MVAECAASDTRSPLRLLADIAGADLADAGAAAEAAESPLLPELAFRLPMPLTPAEAAAPAGSLKKAAAAAAAAAPAVKSSVGATAVTSAAGAAEQADRYFHLSPRSNLRHQAADRLRRILCSWCAKLALRGRRVVDLALHVLQRALRDLPLGSVDSNALRVLLAACLWTAAKLDGGHQKDVPNGAAMSSVSLVEVSVLQAAELQLMKMMKWKPLEGFEE
ncbi:unnamed protein product [Closterium sp. Naga37s-1]|nr:unnamed protein product [Closterium sp. Naga37s-1]